ncbi:MAG: hypothetical protein JWO06_3104 [Bacteroidota bacterium]|nr:hypothetical protein [Bacteroidota bacterium]
MGFHVTTHFDQLPAKLFKATGRLKHQHPKAVPNSK